MPQVHVRFFGPAVEMAGASERVLDLPPFETLGALAGRLAAAHGQLGQTVGVRLAVNRKYVPLDYVMRDGDEVAVIPPVSGG